MPLPALAVMAVFTATNSLQGTFVQGLLLNAPWWCCLLLPWTLVNSALREWGLQHWACWRAGLFGHAWTQQRSVNVKLDKLQSCRRDAQEQPKRGHEGSREARENQEDLHVRNEIFTARELNYMLPCTMHTKPFRPFRCLHPRNGDLPLGKVDKHLTDHPLIKRVQFRYRPQIWSKPI